MTTDAVASMESERGNESMTKISGVPKTLVTRTTVDGLRTIVEVSESTSRKAPRGRGVAKCMPTDRFVPAVGEGIARGRALQDLGRQVEASWTAKSVPANPAQEVRAEAPTEQAPPDTDADAIAAFLRTFSERVVGAPTVAVFRETLAPEFAGRRRDGHAKAPRTFATIAEAIVDLDRRVDALDRRMRRSKRA